MGAYELVASLDCLGKVVSIRSHTHYKSRDVMHLTCSTLRHVSRSSAPIGYFSKLHSRCAIFMIHWFNTLTMKLWEGVLCRIHFKLLSMDGREFLSTCLQSRIKQISYQKGSQYLAYLSCKKLQWCTV